MNKFKLLVILFFIIGSLFIFSAEQPFVSGREWICIVKNAPIYDRMYTTVQLIKLKIRKFGSFQLLNTIKPVEHIRSSNDNDYDWLKFKKDNKTFYTPYEFFAPRVKELTGNRELKLNVVIDKWNNIPFHYKPRELKRIPPEYVSPYQRQYPYFLRKEALEAFIKLFEAAKKEKILLFAASTWRSPEVQSGLYLQNILAAGPKQKGSAKPTYSEHHLGTTVDLTSSAVGYRLTQDFYNTKEYIWLSKNIRKFNMRITYSRTAHYAAGYIWEPWHVRYMGDRYFHGASN